MNSTPLLLRILVLSLFGAASVQQLAATENYKFDQKNSTIGFRVRQFLGGANGKFKQFSGNVTLDREHPEQSSVTAKIQVASIDTEIKKRDDHLRSEEFFNVAKYPEMTFKSKSAKQTGPQTGDILGDLTLHGVTKPVTLHVKLLTPVSNQPAATTKWSITAALKRGDFNLKFANAAEAVSGISQDVTIRMEIEATRQ